jgi:hypothetical protein
MPTIYDPSATSPMVDEFLRAFTSMRGEDGKYHARPEVQEFLLQLVASSLDGTKSLKKMLILHGSSTNNGKTTFVDLLSHTLGSNSNAGIVASVTPNEFDSYKPNTSLTPELVAAVGCRIMLISEPKDGLYLAADKLKAIAGGGGQIQLNPKNKRCFSYSFHCLPIMDTNIFPAVNDMSLYNSGRVACVNCEWQVERIDPSYRSRLLTAENASAFLNLLIESYRHWAENGFVLTEPAELKDYVENRKNDSNVYRRFIVARCEVTGNHKSDVVSIKTLNDALQDYMSEEQDYNKEAGKTKRPLENILSMTPGVNIKTDHSYTRVATGIRLLTQDELDLRAQGVGTGEKSTDGSESELMKLFCKCYTCYDPDSSVQLDEVERTFVQFATAKLGNTYRYEHTKEQFTHLITEKLREEWNDADGYEDYPIEYVDFSAYFDGVKLVSTSKAENNLNEYIRTTLGPAFVKELSFAPHGEVVDKMVKLIKKSPLAGDFGNLICDYLSNHLEIATHIKVEKLPF